MKDWRISLWSLKQCQLLNQQINFWIIVEKVKNPIHAVANVDDYGASARLLAATTLRCESEQDVDEDDNDDDVDVDDDDGEVDDDDDDDDDNSDAPIVGCDNLEQDVEVEDNINNFGWANKGILFSKGDARMSWNVIALTAVLWGTLKLGDMYTSGTVHNILNIGKGDDNVDTRAMIDETLLWRCLDAFPQYALY